MDRKFCLKWNNFQENTIQTFSKLRIEEDFYDVTLVSDDQKQIPAHKVVLSSSSKYFKNILKSNMHSHPMLCLNGITSMELENVLDYIYKGEVQIFHENIDKFLNIARRLQINGLLSSDNYEQLISNQSIETEHEPASQTIDKLNEASKDRESYVTYYGYDNSLNAAYVNENLNQNEVNDEIYESSFRITSKQSRMAEEDHLISEILDNSIENDEIASHFCIHCKFSSNDVEEFLAHLKLEEHLKNTKLKTRNAIMLCKVCNMSFKKYRDVVRHLRTIKHLKLMLLNRKD